MADEIVASKMPSLNGYGQNGYTGPSSVTKPTDGQSGFLPGVSQDDLTAALDRVAPKDGRDTVRDATGKGNPPAPKDFKQPKFAAPQTRELDQPTAKERRVGFSFGMDQRSLRNR